MACELGLAGCYSLRFLSRFSKRAPPLSSLLLVPLEESGGGKPDERANTLPKEKASEKETAQAEKDLVNVNLVEPTR